MLPFTSRRSRTFFMSKRSYFASRTPRARFSKSQNTAMLRVSVVLGIEFPGAKALRAGGQGSVLVNCHSSRPLRGFRGAGEIVLHRAGEPVHVLAVDVEVGHEADAALAADQDAAFLEVLAQ